MLESMRVIIWFSPMRASASVPSSPLAPSSDDDPEPSSAPATLPTIMEVMSKPVLMICRGYTESVSSSTDLM